MRPILLYILAICGVWSWSDAARRSESDLASEAARLRAHNAALAHRLYAVDSVDPVSGKLEAAALIEKAFEIEGVDWDERQADAMLRLCWRESRYNPMLQNPRSSAFGLYQFLDSTWRGTRVSKTTDPLLQTIAAVRYIKSRYGTPRRALEFHLVAREVNGVVQHYY